MNYAINKLINFSLVFLVSIFLVACSSEEEDAELSTSEQSVFSELPPEELSELAEEVSKETAEETDDFVSVDEIEYPLNKSGLPEFLKVLESNQDVQASYNACPLKIFQKYKSYKDHLSINDSYEDQCAKDPAGCLKQCIEDRNGPVCHDLAYVLEANETEITPRYGKMMYAQACATGWPLSCTNRGAGIRNSIQEDDPFFKKDEAETNICLNATFEKMCDEKDAWGCYMTGSSYSEGEGREINETKAEEFYKRACDVDPESGACSN